MNVIGGFGSAKKQKIGNQPPKGKIAIFDKANRYRGHVGRLATSATLWRFGIGDAELTKKNGRQAWQEKK